MFFFSRFAWLEASRRAPARVAAAPPRSVQRHIRVSQLLVFLQRDKCTNSFTVLEWDQTCECEARTSCVESVACCKPLPHTHVRRVDRDALYPAGVSVALMREGRSLHVPHTHDVVCICVLFFFVSPFPSDPFPQHCAPTTATAKLSVAPSLSASRR